MRRFSSYGQINPRLHYYAPRTALIERASTQLVGEKLEEGGHYITVWAPRQTEKRYQAYLQKNADWLFEHAPRRADLRIREAVYHFNLYLFLHQFLHTKGARVWPEFPTGNGKLDILISYRERLYGLEVKSFADLAEFKKALEQAASYGKQLHVAAITLVFFIESIDDDNRRKYEAIYTDESTGVTVKPVFVETGV